MSTHPAEHDAPPPREAEPSSVNIAEGGSAGEQASGTVKEEAPSGGDGGPLTAPTINNEPSSDTQSAPAAATAGVEGSASAVAATTGQPQPQPPTETATDVGSSNEASASLKPESGGASTDVVVAEEKDVSGNGHPSGDSASAPAVAARVPTPSSRTSTPPVPSKKKFSSVSVTKEFLSKAVSPVPAPAKQARPTAAAAPSQSTPKLLSSKLTSVPSSKPSTSPNPPGAAAPSAAAPSPWAKPAVVDSAQLQHPAPTRGGLPNVAMGSGQGLGRRTWGPISGNESRRMAPGISRDFPTAKEVADGEELDSAVKLTPGKRKAMLNAQAIAQAEAAHNQAILADLNAFTHIEANAHRWDEEDEDEEIIDFGDGRTYSVAQPPPQPEPAYDEPVAKSERFGEDMGRNWPRRAVSPPRAPQSERVLFNANSNRLEPTFGRQGQSTQQQPQQSQPVRLMSRDSGPQVAHDRAPPPHVAEAGRMLPPHMGGGHAQAPSSAPRSSWRAGPPSSDREVPPHLAEHREPRHDEHHQQAVSRPAPPPTRPPPQRMPQAAPPPPKAPSVTSPLAAATVPLPAIIPAADEQAAEMHSAAEKARQRRLAEEAEREAAAERARQKARELAERFGEKPAAAAPAPPPGLSKAPPPGLEKPSPTIIVASRPKPVEGAPVEGQGPPAPADAAQSWRRSGPLPEPRGGKARRPSNDPARGEIPRDLRRAHDASMQARNQVPREAPPHVPVPAPESTSPVKARIELGHYDHIAAPVPQSSKREANFDTMLARLQAAMQTARLSPPPGMPRGGHHELETVVDLAEGDAEVAGSGLEQALEATEAPTPTVVKRKVKPTPPRLPYLPPDFFNATQLEIPRSPPPAWRLYTVKLPSSQPRNSGNIPRWRLKQAEGPRAAAPRGWGMTYSPPISNLPPSHSLPDLLLPQPIGRRFAKQVDTGPIISISPRRLLPYKRKAKTRPQETRPDTAPQAPPLSTAPVAEPSQTQPALHTAPEPLLPQQQGPPQQPQAPSQTQARLARMVAPQAQPQPPAADKPAVRFMVSSELDGDSLLEEVNKMSLEHIGEADDKGSSKVTQQKKPGTPPPTASQTLNATSPNAAQGPWAKSTLAYNVTSPARGDVRSDVQQRERVKSVWEQSSSDAAPKSAISAPSQPDTPMYPSLNSPAVVPAEAPKGGYGMSQQSSFGSRSSFSQPGAYGQFVGSGSTSPEGGMGVNYGLMNRNGGAASANGFQQGLWAPGFGNSMASPGYGFKGGMEKNGAFAKDGAASGAYPSDFRYNTGGVASYQQQQGAYNGFPQGQVQGHAHAQGQYRSPTSSYHVGGGYGHTGFGTQMAAPRAASATGGRFPSMGANGEYQQQQGGQHQGGYDPSYFAGGGYEAGFGQGQHQQQQHQQHQQQQAQGQQGQQHGQQGHGQHGQGRVGRKMW